MTPITSLLLFAAWTLLVMFLAVNWRLLEIARGVPANSWTRGSAKPAPAWVTRFEHAHMNCLESLPVFAVIVLAAFATEKLTRGTEKRTCGSVQRTCAGEMRICATVLATCAGEKGSSGSVQGTCAGEKSSCGDVSSTCGNEKTICKRRKTSCWSVQSSCEREFAPAGTKDEKVFRG